MADIAAVQTSLDNLDAQVAQLAEQVASNITVTPEQLDALVSRIDAAAQAVDDIIENPGENAAP